MNVDKNDPPFTEVENDSLLQCNHDDMPVYIAPLKAVLTFGHYVFVVTKSGKSIVAEISQNSVSLPLLICRRHKTLY
jgi:hypothetical protein